MGAKILLEEEQRFTGKAIRSMIDIIAIFLLVGSAISFLFGKNSGNEAALSFLTAFIITGMLGYLLKRSCLYTQLREDGVYVKFSPFHRHFQAYPWDSIARLYIRQYNGFHEFGGWGLKIGPGGTAFTVSGNMGIQLVLQNNSHVLIGTNQVEFFISELAAIGKLNTPVS